MIEVIMMHKIGAPDADQMTLCSMEQIHYRMETDSGEPQNSFKSCCHLA
jgi:hypothetical protein